MNSRVDPEVIRGPSRPGPPAPNAAPSCICQPTGPGPNTGTRSGTTFSTSTRSANSPRPRPDHRSPLETQPPAARARPEEPQKRSWTDQQTRAVHLRPTATCSPPTTSTRRLRGSRLRGVSTVPGIASRSSAHADPRGHADERGREPDWVRVVGLGRPDQAGLVHHGVG
jgi:hypothetical protein